MYEMASKIKPKDITFLWRRRFPLGTMSLIAGRPGSGKSQLALLMASELSREGLVSVISNAEDDMESVLKPRLQTQGGKQNLIYLMRPDSIPLLPLELPMLENMIRETEASLLVMDPISAHFTSNSALHNRQVLRRLARLAARTRCAIVGVHHTIKGGGELIAQVGGSMGGLVGSCRAVYVFRKGRGVFNPSSGVWEPDDHGRELVCVKINGVAEPPPLVLEMVTYEIAHGIEAPRLKVLGHSFGRETEEVAVVSEWLTRFLAAGQDGHRLHGEIRQCGQEQGFSWTMLQALGSDLGFLSWNGQPRWQLPREHPLRGTASV